MQLASCTEFIFEQFVIETFLADVDGKQKDLGLKNTTPILIFDITVRTDLVLYFGAEECSQVSQV